MGGLGSPFRLLPALPPLSADHRVGQGSASSCQLYLARSSSSVAQPPTRSRTWLSSPCNYQRPAERRVQQKSSRFTTSQRSPSEPKLPFLVVPLLASVDRGPTCQRVTWKAWKPTSLKLPGSHFWTNRLQLQIMGAPVCPFSSSSVTPFYILSFPPPTLLSFCCILSLQSPVLCCPSRS